MTNRFTPLRMASLVGLSLLAWSAVAAVCLCFGTDRMMDWPIAEMNTRLGRVVSASLIGAALAAAGVTLQALLRNPLASPSILGISSGAATGVAFGWFVAQGPWFDLPIAAIPDAGWALLFGLLTIAVVYALAQRRGHLDPLTLLLVGVMVAAFCGAIVMVINLLVPHGLRADMAVWMMGMVAERVSWASRGWSAVVIGGGVLLLLAMSHQFNLESMGDATARTLGVRVQAVRVLGFFTASVITAVAVSLSGPIGFVGLICPHVCRRLFGPDHRVLLITATAFGAAFLCGADTLVRAGAGITHGEFPVGVVTALCGGPYFLYLLRCHLGRREAPV